MRKPRYPGYPRVRPPPTFLQPRESSTRTSIDVAARFARWNGVEEEEEEEEGEEEGEWAALLSPAPIRAHHSPPRARCPSSTRTSIDVAARFARWNGAKEEEEEEEGE